MSYTEKMTIDERRKYLRLMKPRYKKAGRVEKGRLLNEMEEVTGLNRKTLTRLMHNSLERKPRSRERGPRYGAAFDDALRVIYESLDYICAERLTSRLVWMGEHLAKHGELEITAELLVELDQVSVSTVERRLKRFRQDRPQFVRKKRGVRNHRLQSIPMCRLSWDLAEPGHLETDLVFHCGPRSEGEFTCTLQLIDVATGWSERRAVLGRSYLVMEDAFLYTLGRLPFPVLEIHPDNGNEFLSHHMLRFWGEIVQDVILSRSRPYKKNDNPRVEQKNFTLVREYLGYARIDTAAQTVMVNRLYDKMWIYYNLFQPVMHLIEKEVICVAGQPAQVKRKHDEPTPPFDRLCQTDAILPEHRQLLETLRDSINPRQLRQEIYDMIEVILKLPGAAPSVTENVYETLAKKPSDEDRALALAFNRTKVKS